MIYRLKELKGDTIAVPQLVFSKLGIAEEYNVRVALYVLATGITDPDKICADLRLRSRISVRGSYISVRRRMRRTCRRANGARAACAVSIPAVHTILFHINSSAILVFQLLF